MEIRFSQAGQTFAVSHTSPVRSYSVFSLVLRESEVGWGRKRVCVEGCEDQPLSTPGTVAGRKKAGNNLYKGPGVQVHSPDS